MVAPIHSVCAVSPKTGQQVYEIASVNIACDRRIWAVPQPPAYIYPQFNPRQARKIIQTTANMDIVDRDMERAEVQATRTYSQESKERRSLRSQRSQQSIESSSLAPAPLSLMQWTE